MSPPQQHVFTVTHHGRSVPAVVWTPEGAPPEAGAWPLALIGHGGAGHKLDDSRQDLAQRYADLGMAAAAIDGPWHGERALPEGATRPSTDDGIVDAMVEDWRATIDELAAMPAIDAKRIGYGGVSMGTMFGLPLVAVEPRIRAAVLGLCGLVGSDGAPTSLAVRLEGDATAIDVPVLFLVQWSDQLFPRDGCFALFDALATAEKQLLASPGLHHESPPRARAASTGFLAEQLGAASEG